MILVGRIIHFLLMLATLRIVTTLLSPAELGKIAIITTAVAFFSSFLINPVGMYVNRQLHTWNATGVINNRLGFHFVYLFAMAVISSAILGAVSYFEIFDFHLPVGFIGCFVFCTLFFNTINQTTIPSLNMLGFRGWFTILSIGTLLSSLIFAVLMVHYCTHSSEYWLSGLLLGQVLFGIFGYSVLHSKINHVKSDTTTISKQDINTVFKFSWPIALTVGLTWLQSQSYRFFVEDTLGLDVLGLFVAGYGISAGIIAGFESVFTMYYQPVFYKQITTSDKENRVLAWNAYASSILPSLILLFFVLFALASKLALFMLAPQFQAAAKFVSWGAFIEVFRVMANVYSMMVYAEKETKILILPNAIGAITSLLMLYFLIPRWGVLGVVWALSLAGFCVMVFLHIQLKIKLPIHIPFRRMGVSTIFGFIICMMSYFFQLQTT